MELSENDIKLIVRLVSEKLGPNAGIEDIKSLAAEIIERFPSIPSTLTSNLPKKLIINAFGPDNDGLEDKIQSHVNSKSIRVMDISTTVIEKFRSVVAIIDYSSFNGDLSQFKFELNKICVDLGFKAIIQDSGYYGL